MKLKFQMCVGCGYRGLTRDEARRSYGRMIGNSVSAESAKKHSPRCVTILLKLPFGVTASQPGRT
jgi:hypothetical protein